MHQVQLELSDQLYDEAKRRAAEAGFTSVGEFAAKVVVNNVHEDSEFEVVTGNVDHLFTPERLALIDAAAAQIKAGNFYTTEQVRERFAEKRGAWIRENQG